MDEIENLIQMGFMANLRRCLKGKKSLKFLEELEQCLLKLESKRLIGGNLERDGDYCALGSVFHSRGLDTHPGLNVESPDLDQIRSEKIRYRDWVAAELGIKPMLASEIMYQNEEGFSVDEDPGHRYKRMLSWVQCKIAAADSVKEPEHILELEGKRE